MAERHSSAAMSVLPCMKTTEAGNACAEARRIEARTPRGIKNQQAITAGRAWPAENAHSAGCNLAIGHNSATGIADVYTC